MEAVGATDPARCVYVGDRLFDDVWGAHNAGLRAIHIPHSTIPRRAGRAHRGRAGRRRAPAVRDRRPWSPPGDLTCGSSRLPAKLHVCAVQKREGRDPCRSRRGRLACFCTRAVSRPPPHPGPDGTRVGSPGHLSGPRTRPAPGNISGVPRKASSRTAAVVQAPSIARARRGSPGRVSRHRRRGVRRARSARSGRPAGHDVGVGRAQPARGRSAARAAAVVRRPRAATGVGCRQRRAIVAGQQVAPRPVRVVRRRDRGVQRRGRPTREVRPPSSAVARRRAACSAASVVCRASTRSCGALGPGAATAARDAGGHAGEQPGQRAALGGHGQARELGAGAAARAGAAWRRRAGGAAAGAVGVADAPVASVQRVQVRRVQRGAGAPAGSSPARRAVQRRPAGRR